MDGLVAIIITTDAMRYILTLTSFAARIFDLGSCTLRQEKGDLVKIEPLEALSRTVSKYLCVSVSLRKKERVN